MQQADLSGAHWRKSSLSADGPSCVEVAFVDDAVAVRDTKDREGGTLVFRRDKWTAFVGGIKNGDFDTPS
ncbi:DUF397 domain-containing protein [Streptosporangium roseum]|uniref:DUF397 domain-containing protein n=1 Tax=Streptosporangium roseum (strain ATCC 12428 / DSM 43021 / JCM 3005 / KCTC 9067 / NCIMB 10171 / NRRL 2505 / NI 9100) TaxID=479432 RepID=D2AT15_STRRD|nr:DUF397 domain-containing protein [Streptosporangium roseum]ACZ90492.1 hypothetical protein Sros_7828 [Streptosporangium roseum DSM 43021]